MTLEQQMIRVAEDILVWPVHERGELVYRVEISAQHKFLRIGYREYVLMSYLNGETSLPQACGMATQQLGVDAPSSSESRTIIRWLLKNEIAYVVDDGPPDRQAARLGPGQDERKASWLSRLNPFWMKCPLPAADRVINSFARRLDFLASKPMVMLAALFCVITLVIAGMHWDNLTEQTSELFLPQNWLWLVGVWLALKVVHELGHAVVCSRFGGEVHQAGIAFVLFAPMAYVDVSSCWRMPSRWSRIAVGAAGMGVELVAAAVAVWIFVLSDDPSVRYVSQTVILAASVSTLLFNANVLMRFDGYFMLADLLDIPNLATEGSTALRQLVRGFIDGEPQRENRWIGWRYPVVVGYGIAALMWRVLVCVTLAIAASTLWSGAGLVITFMGLAIWLGAPLRSLASYFGELYRFHPIRFARAAVLSGVSVVALVIVFGVVPIPNRVRVPVITRFSPDCQVRSASSGFIDDISVASGDHVIAGQVLMRLHNHELTCNTRQLEKQLEQYAIKLRKATGEHNEGQAQVLRQHAQTIQTRLTQLRTREAALIVRSPQDGRVIADDLAEKVGTYVEEGDTLMVVGDDADKEWVTLVGQDQIRLVKASVGQPIKVYSAGRRTFDSRLERIDPRATTQLTQPELAASVGGPLPVQEKSDDSGRGVRLLSPHFQGQLEVPQQASDVGVGTRLWAECGYQSRSLAAWIRMHIQSLWDQAQRDSR